MKKMGGDNKEQVLHGLVDEAVIRVFEAYDADLESTALESPGHEIVSVIGYAADEVRGGLALGISRNLAQRTMPTQHTPLYDWVGELANQIIGRVRNKILAYKIDLQIATPVVLHGLGVQVAPPGVYVSKDVVCYRSGEDFVQVLLEARFEEGFELPEAVMDDEAVDEGEMLLF